MNLLDVILLATIVIGFTLGYKTGIIRQLSFGAGVALGLFQAIDSYGHASTWLADTTGWDKATCAPIAFILILALTVLVIHLAGVFLSKAIRIACLGIVDKILGAAFTAYFAILILSVTVSLTEELYPDNDITGKTSQKESLLYKGIVGTSFLVIEEATREIEDR